MDMTVLEREHARFKWLQQEQNHDYVNQNNPFIETCQMPQFQGFFDHHLVSTRGLVDWNVINKPKMHLGSVDLLGYGKLPIAGDGSKFEPHMIGLIEAEAAARSTEVDHCLSRSSSCKIGAVEVTKMEDEVERVIVEVASGDTDVVLMEEMRSNFGGDALISKRKPELVEGEEIEGKRIKREIKVECKTQERSSTQISTESSKETQRSSGFEKQDYIHVRARRGQATDSHSLAERARREKISMKMKYLQDLVPGCNKITGRAGMLDEIINYVQSLQKQVEFLSMKLAALNPRQELNIENFCGKELPAHVASFPAANTSTAIANLPHLQLNVAHHQQTTGSKPELPINPPEMLNEIETTSSIFLPELCPDTSLPYSHVQSFWDSIFTAQNL